MNTSTLLKIIQHSTAQHSTAQHSTAQHSTAQHSQLYHYLSNTLVLFCP
ncbi:methyltransferase [Veillonella sp. AF13-2]|nr:methyltransferase [Veillonella sp. AF13-2]